MAEKLKVVAVDDGFEIIGNRQGLLGLADICTQLARLPEDAEKAKRLGNHYHYAPWMNNTEDESIPLTILYKPDL
jgi:hypothetical protein